MSDEQGGAPGAETANIGASGAPVRERRMTARRKQEAVLRVLRGDGSAVAAALSLPWSNGQTEGHVTKLKLVKRQMYGRAKPDLLRARILGAA